MADGSEKFSKWSSNAFPLRTALDVLGLPCSVKLTELTRGVGSIERLYESVAKDNVGDDILDKNIPLSRRLPRAVELTVQEEVSLFYIKAKVLYLPDPAWSARVKGEQFVAEHAQFVGQEILLPLTCRDRVQLKILNFEREYYNINQVIEDFPKFVYVEEDTACRNIGKAGIQVVKAGTQLELDRVAKGPKGFRGNRDDYLICKDSTSGLELAFQVPYPIHFSRMNDSSRYTLSQIVEQIPLPQTVTFCDVIQNSISHEIEVETFNAATMLSGPVELTELLKLSSYVCSYRKADDNTLVCLLLPSTSADLNTVQVHLPNHKGRQSFRRMTHSSEKINCDILKYTLYVQYYNQYHGVLLKTDIPGDAETVQEEPEPPTFPMKYGNATLKATSSVPMIATAEGPELARKRFMSTGDVTKSEFPSETIAKRKAGRSFSSYFSRLFSTFRRKRYGSMGTSVSSSSSDTLGTSRSLVTLSRCSLPRPPQGFRCYINETYLICGGYSDTVTNLQRDGARFDHEDTETSTHSDSDNESCYMYGDYGHGLSRSWKRKTSKLDRLYDIGAFYCEICRENTVEENEKILLDDENTTAFDCNVLQISGVETKSEDA